MLLPPQMQSPVKVNLLLPLYGLQCMERFAVQVSPGGPTGCADGLGRLRSLHS